MQRVWANLRAIFEQAVEDVDRFPDSTRHKATEQGNVGIGDVIVPQTSPAAVAEVVLTEQVVLVYVPLRAVRRRALTGPPQFGQHRAIVAINHADIGIEQFLLGDMILVDISHLAAIDSSERARRLRWAQVAPIAESGGHIP